ncbi:hypothetical protein ACFWYW_58985 [Nonomuraea sp. NPDC059023]|uniref:hypothetical protein n=1 Tax=unclassified Nonomuraea TaxID=2593643 RepID=UPI003673E27F
MSYDISLHIDTGAPEDEWPTAIDVGNYTANVSVMWRTALGGTSLRAFDGANAGESAPALAAAVKAMEGDPECYREMNPPNGWGNYEGALDYLRALAEACATHPKCKIRVSC